MPTTYYYPGSPIGQTIAKRREVLAAKGEKGRYGIVGLGTGSSACHKREGETWRFFEIDPTVIKIAKNPKNFTFISKCQPDIDIVIGDARLTIAKEQDESFDLFIIDAFTSDAIPVHMLTKEAVKLYPRQAEARRRGAAAHLQPLPRPRTRCWARSRRSCRRARPASSCRTRNADGSYGQSTSTVVIFAKSEEALQPYRSLDGRQRARRRRPARLDRRLLRHPGAFMNRFAGRG